MTDERMALIELVEKAADADLVIVNHALLMANVASGGNIFDTEGRHLIVDEAHVLEDVMSEALGARVIAAI